MSTPFTERLVGALNAFYEGVMRFLPGLLAALLVVALGLAVAWLVKAVTRRILVVTRFDRFCDAWGVTQALNRADIRSLPSAFAARILAWLVFLSFAMAGLSALELAVVRQLVAEFFLYLPRLFAAMLILLVGFVVGNFLSRAVLLAAVNANVPSPRGISLMVKLLIAVLVVRDGPRAAPDRQEHRSGGLHHHVRRGDAGPGHRVRRRWSRRRPQGAGEALLRQGRGRRHRRSLPRLSGSPVTLRGPRAGPVPVRGRSLSFETRRVPTWRADSFIILLGGLLVLAFLADEAFRWLRIPSVLVLMGCGLLLGPVFHLLPAEEFTRVAPHFGALAFLLILFEGGLDLDFRTVLGRLAPGAALALFGFLAAFALASIVARVGGLPWGSGGRSRESSWRRSRAPSSCPCRGRLGLRQEVRTLVVLEGALADVLGVLGLGLAVQLHTGGGLAGLVALGSMLAALFSVGLAGIAGLLWPRLLRELGDRRYVHVLTFGVALVLWGAVELLGASGALVVLTFGLTLGNEGEILRTIGLDPAPVADVATRVVAAQHEFIAQLTFLVRAFFFVFLGVVVRFEALLLGARTSARRRSWSRSWPVAGCSCASSSAAGRSHSIPGSATSSGSCSRVAW